ncbi:penicillin-binding protein activator [Marinobacter fonticola]|uniref:penicillin-binding protein activator n=1 Tax=Marinobacter fonticola TaxID=2603215 RepID=UPI0011E8699C|nr:penicillin-binding protein activator [Marinobacter fonticola]
MTTRALFGIRPAFFLAFVLLAAGCTPLGIQPDQADSPQGALAIAESAGYSDTALRGLLSTAARYQDADRHRDARTILQSEALKSNASGDTLHQYRLLAMASIVALDDRQWAQRFAQDLPIDQFAKYPPDRRARAIRLQVDTFDLAGDYLSAAQTLIGSAPAADDGATATNNDRIWQLLKRTTTMSLNQAAEKAIGYAQQGWLELALSLREPGISLETQGKAVRAWQRNWPDHPAASPLPGELQLIVTLSEERPEHVALALPLSGPLADVGRAIRDGYFAAYYSDEERGNEKLRIDVYDTHNQAFPALYQDIHQTGPDLIVGPLDKKALNAIAPQASLNTPLLALNYLDDANQAPAQLYQYGLSAEDEARQIAERLVADDRPQAVALIPFGEWGDRIEQALISRMNEIGGKILNVVRYDREENFRNTVASLFDIGASRQRAITVEETIGLNIEFEPRRRQDIDAIVLVASPTIGRQFNPLFAFYFGGNLPVYAPSTIYSGSPDPARDSDLENVRFTDIPWMLTPDMSARQRTSAALPDVTQRYGRLFAMGMDAYALSSKLQLLSRVPDSDLKGLTGTLSMTPAGVVSRDQQWAIFQQGKPVKLEPAVTADEEKDTGTLKPIQ